MMTNASSAALQKTEIPLRYLTKTLFRKALKCPRKLVYATNPSLYPQNKADPLYQHLSQEGERFGEYCKRLFPHGVENKDKESQNNDDLVAQTHHTLMEGHDTNKRVTVFEGAVSHGSFYVQPDILDKIISNGQIELRVIEAKSKSWDSRYTIQEKMFSPRTKAIKSQFLPYIQDVAFQSYVCQLVYPDVQVSSWLMLPDRAKNMKYNPSDNETSANNPESSQCLVPTVDETMQAIDDSIASLLNVDEYVEIALSSEVSYAGSNKGETFKDVAQRWAEQLNDDSFALESFSTPIGMQCTSCEYRLKDPPEGTYSGFDSCWQDATGMEKEELQKNPLVLDLYGKTKASLGKFLSKKKFALSDLSARDFDLSEDFVPLLPDGTEARKKTHIGISISKCQRQLYQVQTNKRSTESETNLHPRYIKRKQLNNVMKSWQYPLHFIDFETIAPAVPYYLNMSPYDITAFQFSHHIIKSENGDGTMVVEHASEFLHTLPGSPTVPFLKALLNAIGSVETEGGTIFQWSPHETHVLRSMLSSPEVSDALSSQEISVLSAILNTGMVDLCKLAGRYYYVDGSGGSSSIKRLLKSTLNASTELRKIYGSPTYNSRNFDNFQWYQLDGSGLAKDPYDIISGIKPDEHESANVSEGGAACAAFHELQNNLDLDTHDRKAIENSLLRYCELDTLAMVMIFQAWLRMGQDQRLLGNAEVMTEISIKPKSIKKRKTRDDKRQEYETPYEKALDKLSEKGNDPIDAKLTRVQCAAIITLGFDTYTVDTGKVDDLRRALKTEIGKGQSKMLFWKHMDEIKSERCRLNEPTSNP